MTCITEYCCFRVIGAETEHEPLLETEPLLGPNAVTTLPVSDREIR